MQIPPGSPEWKWGCYVNRKMLECWCWQMGQWCS